MSTTLRPMTWFPNQGLDLQRPAHLVGMSMADDGYDFVLSDNSKLTKRPGISGVNYTQMTGSGVVYGLRTLNFSNGTTYELVNTQGLTYLESGGGVTSVVITGRDYTEPWAYTQFLDRGIFVNSSSFAFFYASGASGNISAGPSAGIACETHLNKLFIAIKGTSQFWYSATGSADTFTGAGTDIVNVEQNDGSDISALKSFARNELAIFKENSMHKLIGESKNNFVLVKVDGSVGCVCQNSIQNFRSSTGGGLMIWAYRDGLYTYAGDTPKKISFYVNTEWEAMNKARFKWMQSAIDVDNGRYYLTYATGSNTSNSRIMVVDLLHPWTDDNGLHFPIYLWRVSAESLNVEFTSSNAQKMVMGTTNGFKREINASYKSDMGTEVSAYVSTPLMPMDDGIGNENCLRRIYAPFLTTDGEVSVYTELKDGTDWQLAEMLSSAGTEDQLDINFILDESILGPLVSTFSARMNTSVRSRRIKVKVEQISSSNAFTLEAPVEFYFKGGGQRA